MAVEDYIVNSGTVTQIVINIHDKFMNADNVTASFTNKQHIKTSVKNYMLLMYSNAKQDKIFIFQREEV